MNKNQRIAYAIFALILVVLFLHGIYNILAYRFWYGLGEIILALFFHSNSKGEIQSWGNRK